MITHFRITVLFPQSVYLRISELYFINTNTLQYRLSKSKYISLTVERVARMLHLVEIGVTPRFLILKDTK